MTDLVAVINRRSLNETSSGFNCIVVVIQSPPNSLSLELKRKNEIALE